MGGYRYVFSLATLRLCLLPGKEGRQATGREAEVYVKGQSVRTQNEEFLMEVHPIPVLIL